MRPTNFTCLAALLLSALTTHAQPAPPPETNAPFSRAEHLVRPTPPVMPSPVSSFRELLALDPGVRSAALSNRPPEIRERILAKLREYQRLTPDERELRLRATELRWYLTPLLTMPVTNRTTRLALVPGDLRPLVEGRLKLWSILPPPLQTQMLEDDRNLQLYLQLAAGDTEAQQAILRRLPEPQRGTVEAGFARWQSLTDVQQKQAMDRVNRFFDLQPAEKQQVLSHLSDAERRQMERSLQAFEKLSPEKRARCLEAFGRFASLSPEERAQFLASAERWNAMTPAERDRFRKLVQLAPVLPPRPQLPPSRTAMATNRN